MEASVKAAEIETWDRDECARDWARLTGRPPQRGLSIGFLRRALAYEAQCKALSGHSAAVKRQLRSAATEGATKTVPASPPNPALVPGTQLVREWNGRIYRVQVTMEGFEMDGTAFTSLSAIAKRITGADWSGPRFFGLKKR